MTASRVNFARCPVCSVYVPVIGWPNADALRFDHHGRRKQWPCDGSGRDARAASADLIRADVAIISKFPHHYPPTALDAAQAQLAAVEASLAKDGAR